MQLISGGDSNKHGRGIYLQIKCLTGNILNRMVTNIERPDWQCLHCHMVDGPTHWVECPHLLNKPKIRELTAKFRLFLVQAFPRHPWANLSTSRAKICSLLNPYSVFYGGNALFQQPEQGEKLVSWCRWMVGTLLGEYENRSYRDRLGERRVHQMRD